MSNPIDDIVARIELEARALMESQDEGERAFGRIRFHLATAMTRWHAAEMAMGTRPEIVNAMFDTFLGQALAVYVHHLPDWVPRSKAIDWHMNNIETECQRRLALLAKGEPYGR